MMNYSTVLVQNTWGVHLNFEGHFSSPPSCPSWLTQLQQQDWQRRGIVVWDADLRIVAHLHAGYALELLEHLQGNHIWKTNGLVIGSPAFLLSGSAGNSSSNIGGAWILENQIELSADQVQDLVKFLTAQESLLHRISSYDKPIENRELKVLPTSIPRGNYFTVYQAAQICHATSKQIRAWIRKGKLEALNLPGLGIIIDAKKLNEFLYKRNS
jgi:hypothetical protein